MRGERYKVRKEDVDETFTFLLIKLLELRVGNHFSSPLNLIIEKQSSVFNYTNEIGT